MDATSFQWSVAKNGYEWESARPRPANVPVEWPSEVLGPVDVLNEPPQAETDWVEGLLDDFIIPKGGAAQGRDQEGFWRVYAPLVDCPMLFLHFSDVQPTLEEIESFASNFGLLEVRGPWEIPSPESEPRFMGENLFDWVTSLEKVNKLVRLWEALTSKEEDALKHRYEGVVRMMRQDYGMHGFGLQRLPDCPDPMLPAAKSALAHYLSFELRGLVPNVFLTPKGTFGMGAQPRTLLEVIWLQFAQAVTSGQRFQKCETCGKWTELSPAVLRADARYCSQSCQFKAYRQRQKEARKRATTGESVTDIAAALGSTPAVVSRWLHPAPRERSAHRKDKTPAR